MPAALFFALACASADPSGSLVTLQLADGKTIAVDDAMWKSLPAESTTAVDHDKQSHTFDGVALAALLAKNGVVLGDALKGPLLAQVVVVEAKDGYRVAFGIGEVDPATSGRTMTLARSIDGKPLPADKAPLQLVVPGDKRHARWVRQVTAIRVVKAP